MYWIVEQIQKRKMPMELVLLPIVESAFDPGQLHPPMPLVSGRLLLQQVETMV